MRSTSYFRKWLAYRKGMLLAKELTELSDTWPKQEKYKLVDQVVRSSRSVCSNLGESYGKRQYPKHFIAKLSDAASENCETQVWLDFALLFKFITREKYDELIAKSEEVGKLLSYMLKYPDQFRTYGGTKK